MIVPPWPYRNSKVRIGRTWLLNYLVLPAGLEGMTYFGWLHMEKTHMVSWCLESKHFDLYEHGKWLPNIKKTFR